jgi:hypothetical protein
VTQQVVLLSLRSISREADMRLGLANGVVCARSFETEVSEDDPSVGELSKVNTADFWRREVSEGVGGDGRVATQQWHPDAK